MARRLERRIRSEGALSPDDNLVAIEAGDVFMWKSSGQMRPLSRTVMAIGYSPRRLVAVGQDWVTGVDLLMVRRVRLLDEGTPRPVLEITFLHDRDDGKTEIMWKPQVRARARQFTDALLGAANRRQQEMGPAAAALVLCWEQELERRDQEAERLRAEPGPRQLHSTRGFKIEFHTLAFEKAHVPEKPLQSSDGAVTLLDDGRITVWVSGQPVARFKPEAVTYLTFPGPTGITDPPMSPWELGYKLPTGEERHLFFGGPGLALFPGQYDDSASPLLNESGLMDLAPRNGTSWRFNGHV